MLDRLRRTKKNSSCIPRWLSSSLMLLKFLIFKMRTTTEKLENPRELLWRPLREVPISFPPLDSLIRPSSPQDRLSESIRILTCYCHNSPRIMTPVQRPWRSRKSPLRTIRISEVLISRLRNSERLSFFRSRTPISSRLLVSLHPRDSSCTDLLELEKPWWLEPVLPKLMLRSWS